MARPTRILYIEQNAEIGGAPIALSRLVAALPRSRYEPIVVLPRPSPLARLVEREGVRVRFTPLEQLRTLPSPVHQWRYLSRFAPTVRALARAVEEEAADIVHTNNLYCLHGALAARLAGRPHVWHVREIPPSVPGLRRAFGRVAAAWSAALVLMTRACADALFGRGRLPARAVVVPDGLDLRRFATNGQPNRIRRELGWSDDVPVVGFVGRLDPWKGLEVFLKAAAIVRGAVPEARFLVAGGPPSGMEGHERKMRALAGRLGLDGRVVFAGWRWALDDVPDIMGALTVFSHTATRPEPFGLTLVEAMALERPVVAARAGGPLEIVVEGETGYLTPPGDPGAHAAAVTALLADRELARRMGRAGRRRVESRFSLAEFGRRLGDVYARVLAAP